MILFVYGSLHPDRLAELLGQKWSKKPQWGILPGYRRIYAGESKRWGNGGVAGLERCASRSVRGLLYNLSPQELVCLDKWETDVYERRPINIIVSKDGRQRVRSDAYFFTCPSRPYHPPHSSYARQVEILTSVFKQLYSLDEQEERDSAQDTVRDHRRK